MTRERTWEQRSEADLVSILAKRTAALWEIAAYESDRLPEDVREIVRKALEDEREPEGLTLRMNLL